jgi:hypothetical protein
MGKRILFLMILPVLVFALVGVAQAWQGRMGGMEDPFGLVADESDYLIHPAKIANGEGVRFYGDYRFTYTGVTKWDYDKNYYTTGGVWLPSLSIFDDVSGDEQRHDALVGAAFPLGPGRIGLFLTYNGMRGAYDGDYSSGSGGPEAQTLDMKNDLDDFTLRLLYGLPIGGFKLGAEAQIAYCQEKKEPDHYPRVTNAAWLNDFHWDPINIYMYPYDSSYWQALFKGSFEGKVGRLDLEFTVRGGFLFAGDNKWYMELQQPVGVLLAGRDIKGGVDGWQIGEDLWLRYPVAQNLTLPFLVRVDYQEKTRDGNGHGIGLLTDQYDYWHKERDLTITVGGGLDKEFGTATKIAAGIYYNYLQMREEFFLRDVLTPFWSNMDVTYPDMAEHQVLLRLAGEHTLSPAVALRAGLSFFYGWVNMKRDYTQTMDSGFFGNENSPDHGSHWGIGASLGGTIKIPPITLEPFISGGWQQLYLKGDGVSYNNGGELDLLQEKLTRNEWFVGGGFSILFNL